MSGDRSKETLGYCYTTGRKIQLGDNVSIDGQLAIVKEIFQPGTNAANDYGCFDDGGILFLYSNGIEAVHLIGSHEIIDCIT
jgi:hypothetical protein